MAKKKESPASPFVPAEEQPYKIPDNWCWVKLDGLYEINPKQTADDTVLASFVPMERIEAGMTGRFTFEIKPWGKARKGHTQFADGDVAFAKISPCFENRKSMIVQGLMNGIGGGTTELIILRQAHMNQKYTFLLISTEDFISRGIATYSGTVGQQRISMDFVKTYPVPVPPFPEQQRIVSRIESLFCKLDEAKEEAQAVVDGFELRKAAILHKAFSGELTAQWRREHGIGMDSWNEVQLQDVCEKITCGKTPTGFISSDGEIPYLKVYNIVDNKVSFETNRQFIPRNIHEGKLKSSILQPKDVIMNIVGPPLRKIAIIPDDYCEWNMNQAIVRFRTKKELHYKFLYYVLIYPYTLEDVISDTRGVVGQANISVSQSRQLSIVLIGFTQQRNWTGRVEGIVPYKRPHL